jgi:hypothetical protein
MRALKWAVGGFVVSAMLALTCFASMGVMIGASNDQEGLFFLLVLIAFVGLASSGLLLLIIAPKVLQDHLRDTRS